MVNICIFYSLNNVRRRLLMLLHRDLAIGETVTFRDFTCEEVEVVVTNCHGVTISENNQPILEYTGDVRG